MAGRRVALKTIDWLAFAERVPPNQRGMFNALKTRSDAIAAKLVSHQWQLLKNIFISYVTVIYPLILQTKFVRLNEFVLFSLSSFLISLYSRLSSLPEAPAAIDWSYYRSNVANSGMVDEFEKKVSLITQKHFMEQNVMWCCLLFLNVNSKMFAYI